MTKKNDKEFLELMKTNAIKTWMKTLRTERNKDKCKREFPKFLKYLKKQGLPYNPDEIIAQRRNDLRNDDPKIQARWEDIVKPWYHEEYHRFEKEGKSSWTPFTTLNAVRSFFAHHRYGLKFLRGELLQPIASKRKYVPSVEDLRAMVSFAENWKTKSLILGLSQSGLSPIDLCALNIEDFNGKLEEDWVYLEGHRTKTKELYQTCLGIDWINATEKMLALRGYPNKGPLYIQEAGRATGKRLTPRGVRDAIGKVWDACEITTGEEVFEIKNLRDYFENALRRAKVESFGHGTIKRMMGWKLAGAESHYKILPDTIIDAYKGAYKFLTINAFEKVQTSELEKAMVIARMLKIVTSEKPREEALKYVDDLRGVSMDFAGPTSFEELIKRALIELEGA